MNHKRPMGQAKPAGRWKAGMASAVLIAIALLASWMAARAIAQPVGGKAGERPVLFLGNESLPPMSFIKNGRPTGIVIDLAEALAERMHHRVEIRLMNWTEAQRLVLDGQADALLQIDPDPERLKIYDFSEPLLASEFTIFTSAERFGVGSMSDLRGLKVGVEEKGLPILLLQKDPRIILEIVPDLVQAFRMLSAGTLDAVVAERWVGRYVVAENDIPGVRFFDQPISQSHSAIAVKKGNSDLLTDINAALADIRRDGTYGRIIKSWQPKEVVFKTREQLRRQTWFFTAVSAALIVALISVAFLVREIRRRKRFESTLRDSEERLRLFIEHAPASLAMFDREMRYLSASRRWLGDYNLGERNLIGKSHYEVFPEIPEYWKEVHRRGLRGEVVSADDDRFDRADGSVQWLRWEVRPWHDAKNDVAGIVIFTEDITGRKKAEEALYEGEVRYRNLFENMTEEVHFWQLVRDEGGGIKTWRLVDANPPTLNTWGFASLGGIKGKTMDEIFGPGAADHYMPVVQKIMTEGVAYSFEDYFPNLDKYFKFTSIPMGDYFITTGADITGIKKSELALRESEERLRLLGDNLPESAVYQYVHDTDGSVRFLHFSAGIERLNGVKVEDVLRDAGTLHRQVPPGYIERLKEAEAKSARELSDFDMEIPMRLPDGEMRWMRLHSRPRRMPDGSTIWDGVQIDITEFKHIEDELRESKEEAEKRAKEFEAIMDAVPALIWISRDPECLSMTGNRAVYEFLGMPLGANVSKTAPEAERPVHFKALKDGVEVPLDELPMQKAAKGEGVQDYELEYVFDDGTSKITLGNTTPLRGAEGQVYGAVAAFVDITERKRMEEELRKSRDDLELRVRERTAELVGANEELQKQADLLNLSHDAIFVVDSADVVSYWNKSAEDLYGFTREQAVGNVAYEFLHTIFPESLEQVVKQAIATGQWAGELTHTTSRGQVLTVESRWALRRGEDGKPTGFLEVNRDITAGKILEKEFRKTDRAFRTLSEFNQEMVRQTDEMELLRQVCRIVVDVGGYLLVWVGFAENDENKTVVPIASAGQDHGYLAQAGITWADNERGRGPCGISIRTGKMSVSQNIQSNPEFAPWRFEAVTRGIASSISLPLIVEGNVIGALGIYASEPDAFDEGESSLLSNLADNLSYGIASIRQAEKRRQAEEELRVYASRLEVINRELQDFAFAASHDLQEPLRKIQTFCDLAMKRCAPALDTAGMDYLGRVINSADRMRQLLRDLLEFSRVATIPEPLKKIDLSRVVRKAADVFEASVIETGCRIEIENVPAVEADESQMLLLFQNLIGNALKFRSDAAPHIRIYGRSDRKGTCEILVKDNGMGFDRQFAELIFKPFQKLHHSGEYAGTGMGLAICRKIVERHGGTITAESEPGKGSTFIIRLPLKQAGVEAVIARRSS